MAKMSRRRFLEQSAATGLGVAAAGALTAAEQAGPAAAARLPAGLRLCRYQKEGSVHVGFYLDDSVVDLQQLAQEVKAKLPVASTNLLDYLPPVGQAVRAAAELFERFQKLP